jgi:hypothetical protein
MQHSLLYTVSHTYTSTAQHRHAGCAVAVAHQASTHIAFRNNRSSIDTYAVTVTSHQRHNCINTACRCCRPFGGKHQQSVPANRWANLNGQQNYYVRPVCSRTCVCVRRMYVCLPPTRFRRQFVFLLSLCLLCLLVKFPVNAARYTVFAITRSIQRISTYMYCIDLPLLAVYAKAMDAPSS